jgi:hypothetical protein
MRMDMDSVGDPTLAMMVAIAFFLWFMGGD